MGTNSSSASNPLNQSRGENLGGLGRIPYSMVVVPSMFPSSSGVQMSQKSKNLRIIKEI